MKPKIIMGGILVLLLVFMGLLAPALSPYDPNLQNLTNTLQAPGWWGSAHFLGTDHVGRDCLSRIFYGARISLVIAGTVVVISGVIGVGLGAISGYFAGYTDFLIQKLVEVIWGLSPLVVGYCCDGFLWTRPRNFNLCSRGATVDTLLPRGTRTGFVSSYS